MTKKESQSAAERFFGALKAQKENKLAFQNAFSPLRDPRPKFRNVGAFDTENWQKDGYNAKGVFHKKGDFRYGCLLTHNGRHRFITALDMGRALQSRSLSGFHLFAHNLPYDLQNIWGETLPQSGCLIGSSLYFATLQLRDGNSESALVHFRDSIRHYPVKLATLGEKLNIPKLWADCTDLDALNDEEIAERCEHDTYIVFEFVCRLQTSYNELGTSLNATIGSSALELFRRRYQTRAYHQMDESRLICLNAAYYGGRCESFFLGELPVGQYTMGDVNSMYPAVMQSLTVGVPSRELCYHRESPPDSVLDSSGVSRCTVRVPPMMYPPLPWKENKQSKLLFPIGTFSGWWCHNELEYAQSLGVEILKLHESIWFTETCRPFEGYINDLYKMKLEGGWKELVAKHLLNNLYGKFNMSRPPARMISAEDYLEERIKNPHLFKDPQAVDEIYNAKGELRTVIVKPEGFFFPKHANQLWGAYITAGARIKLHGYLVQHRALYCDTDSVLTTDALPQTKELGILALQQKCTGANLRGPKAYALHGDNAKVRVKGIPNRPGWYREYSDDGVAGRWYETGTLQAMALAGHEIAFDAPLKLVEGFRKKSVPVMRNSDDGIPYIPEEEEETRPNLWFTHTKRLKFVSDKRNLIQASGGWTEPIELK